MNNCNIPVNTDEFRCKFFDNFYSFYIQTYNVVQYKNCLAKAVLNWNHYDNFYSFFIQTYNVVPHKNRLGEAVLKWNHNVRFY